MKAQEISHIAAIGNGRNQGERAMVLQWLHYSQHTIKPSLHNAASILKHLNSFLQDRTFLASNTVTIADFCVYKLMAPTAKALNAKKVAEHSAFVRWFDLIQHLVKSGRQEIIDFSSKIAGSESKDLGGKKDEVQQMNGEEEKPRKEEKKEKKEKKEKAKKEVKKEDTKEEEIEPIARVDIRVGKIISAVKHADADSLFVETVDVGEEKPRTVVSGLSGKVPLESLPNRLALFVCNLKPAAMRGVKSEAMILVASCDDVYEIVSPPAGSLPGDRVSFQGVQMKVDEQLNPKKKILETVKVDWKSVDGIAMYQDKPFVTEKGKCFVEIVKNGPIS